MTHGVCDGCHQSTPTNELVTWAIGGELCRTCRGVQKPRPTPVFCSICKKLIGHFTRDSRPSVHRSCWVDYHNMIPSVSHDVRKKPKLPKPHIARTKAPWRF